MAKKEYRTTRKINKVSNQEVIIVRGKVAKFINIILTIASIAIVVVVAFLFALNKIEPMLVGVLVPLALIVYVIMGIISSVSENRKTPIIIYSVVLVICVLVLFFDIVWFQTH